MSFELWLGRATVRWDAGERAMGLTVLNSFLVFLMAAFLMARLLPLVSSTMASMVTARAWMRGAQLSDWTISGESAPIRPQMCIRRNECDDGAVELHESSETQIEAEGGLSAWLKGRLTGM